MLSEYKQIINKTHIWAFVFFKTKAILYVQNVVNKQFLIVLGEQIRKLRLAKNITQEDLGFLIGNSGKQIGRIERGENNVTSCMLYAISKALKIPLKELFDFEIKKPKIK